MTNQDHYEKVEAYLLGGMPENAQRELEQACRENAELAREMRFQMALSSAIESLEKAETNELILREIKEPDAGSQPHRNTGSLHRPFRERQNRKRKRLTILILGQAAIIALLFTLLPQTPSELSGQVIDQFISPRLIEPELGFGDHHAEQLNIAQKAFQNRQFQRSTSMLNKLLSDSTFKDHASANYLLGHIHSENDNPDSASIRFGMVTPVAILFPDARYYRAKALLKKGNLDAAKQQLEEVLKLNSKQYSHSAQKLMGYLEQLKRFRR